MTNTFLKIAEVLDILPCEFYNKYRKWHILHTTFTIVSSLYVLIYVLYTTYLVMNVYQNLILLFNTSATVLIIIVAFNTLLQNLWLKSKKLQDMRKHFKEFDALLPVHCRQYVKKYTTLQAILFYGSYMCSSVALHWILGRLPTVTSIIEDIMFMYFACMMSTIWSFLETVRNQTKNRNYFIKSIFNNIYAVKVKTIQNINFGQNIETCTKMILLNSKVTYSINEIFGFNIFVLTINSLLQLLLILKLYIQVFKYLYLIALFHCLYMLVS